MTLPIQVEIRGPDGSVRVQNFESGPCAIGSSEDNQVVLRAPSVSSRHAILLLRDGAAWIEDLNTASGTLVQGRRIHGGGEVRNGQPIEIGGFVLVVNPTPRPARAAGHKPAQVDQNAVQKPDVQEPVRPEAPPRPEVRKEAHQELLQRLAVKKQIHQELLQRLDIKRLSASHVDENELRKRVLRTLTDIVTDAAPRLPAGMDRDGLTKEIYEEAMGLGPIEDLLNDPEVTEIMVNGPGQIYVERKGKIEITDKAFLDDKSVLAIIERIVSPLGRRIDESQPYVDARLKDGSRVNAVIHPLSLSGPCITIRKFSKIPFTDADLIRFNTLSPAMAQFLKACVLARKNMVVSGGTGSGKTTFLNMLSDYLPDTDRIITIEDAAELRLSQAHVVRLEARPPNIEGRGAITIRDLVRNSLRMRPDRIVVGECRGGEALDMLQAMNTGHDGSLTTVHANSPRDVISRLETMVLMSGMDLPVRAIREQIAAAVDLIVHEARFSDGTRKIASITEIVGLEGDKTTMQDLFVFTQTGVDSNGKVLGRFRPTGSVPTFLEEIRSKGITIDQAIFDPQGGRA